MKTFANTQDNGGLKFRSDDIRWLQDAIIEAISNLSNLNGNTSYWIIAPTITVIAGTTKGVSTAGLMVLNGEICVMDVDMTTGYDSSLPYIYVEPVESFDPAGDKPFFSLPGTHRTYRIVKAKITSYAAAHAGLVDYTTIKDRNQIHSDIISAQQNVFTKVQCLGKGTVVALVGGSIFLGNNGNLFDVNFTSGSTITDMQVAGAGSAGTTISLRFIGTLASDSITIINGSNIITPGGIDYLYHSGDTVEFKAVATNVWALVERKNRSFQPITCAVQSGWSTAAGYTPGFKLTSDNSLLLRGAANSTTLGATVTPSVIFILPVGYRPSRNYKQVHICSDGIYELYVSTSGSVSYASVTVASTTVSLYFDGLVIDLD